MADVRWTYTQMAYLFIKKIQIVLNLITYTQISEAITNNKQILKWEKQYLKLLHQ